MSLVCIYPMVCCLHNRDSVQGSMAALLTVALYFKTWKPKCLENALRMAGTKRAQKKLPLYRQLLLVYFNDYLTITKLPDDR